jgi:hypothetical protein
MYVYIRRFFEVLGLLIRESGKEYEEIYKGSRDSVEGFDSGDP